MTQFRFISIVVFVTIVVAGMTVSIRSQTTPPTTANRPEAGTFLLFKLTNHGQEELYRINTKTGQVSLYSERAILFTDVSAMPNGPEKDGLQKLIESAAQKNTGVYSIPYWDVTPEKRPAIYTIH